MSLYRSSATPASLSSVTPSSEQTSILPRTSKTKDERVQVSTTKDMRISDNGTTVKETTVEQTTFTTTNVGDVAKRYLMDGYFWLFFFIAAIVIIAFYFIAYSGLVWLGGLDKLGWLKQPAAYYAFFIVLYLIGTIPAYISFAGADSQGKALIFSSFFITSALWVLWALIFFVCHDLTWSLVIGMALVISSIMLTASVWGYSRDCGICLIFFFLFY